MARHKIPGDELILHDGIDPMDFRPRWNFTGDVTVTDDEPDDQTVIEFGPATGVSFHADQWGWWTSVNGWEPSAAVYPYNVEFDPEVYAGDDTSWLDEINSDYENGKFALAETGLYTVSLVVEEPDPAFPVHPHGYVVLSELRDLAHEAPLQLFRGGGADVLLGCSINFTTWIAGGDALYVRLVRGDSISTIIGSDVDLHIARILG